MNILQKSYTSFVKSNVSQRIVRIKIVKKYFRHLNKPNVMIVIFLQIQKNAVSKNMIETECKHRYCFDCLMDDQAEVIVCFICRTPLKFNLVD